MAIKPRDIDAEKKEKPSDNILKLIPGESVNMENEFAEAVKNLKENTLTFIEYLQIDAQLKKEKYDALVKEGFSENQAIELCKGNTFQ